MPELLAKLSEVRRTGIAVDQEEFRPGITCVAVPVMLRGRPIAAISASSTHRGPRGANHGQHVAAAATRLSNLLQRSGAFAE